MNNAVIQFIAEFAIRLFSEKPKFFVIIQWISIVVGALAALVTYWESLGKALPDWAQTVGDINVVLVAVTTLIMAQLPNKDPK